MAEIYRDSDVTVALGVPGASSVSAQVVRNGEVVFTSNDDAFGLPFSIIGYDGPFTVKWTFTVGGVIATRTESHVVVTPYVTIDEARDELNLPDSITDSKIIRTERRVRKIIDHYVGYSFGKYKETKSVLGKGDRQLFLPERLVSLETLTGPFINTTLSNYETRGNGYYLARTQVTPDGDWVFTNVIAAPDWGPSPYKVGTQWYYDLEWLDNVHYSVTGEWGWDDVPTEVTEAALILIEQELCPDSEYRNRYVDDTAYGDSSLGFDPRAFTGTGNVIADQLLSDFIRTRFTVI